MQGAEREGQAGNQEAESQTGQGQTLVRDKRDPATGRFVKGNPIRPIHPSGGRPKKLDSKKMLEAIHDEFEPQEIGAMLRQAHQLAVQNEDWKGVLEVARFVMAYAVGKPVQRSIKANIEAEDFARLFRGEEPQEETIDVEYEERDADD